MGLEGRTFIAAAAIAVPMAFSGVPTQAATGAFNFDILNGLIEVQATGLQDPWTATITGDFWIESNLPGNGLGLFVQQPDWILSGSFQAEGSFSGTDSFEPIPSIPIDLSGSELFSDQAGASTPTSAVGVVQQTLGGGLTSPSLLYMLFGTQTALLLDALGEYPGTTPWTGQLALGAPVFGPGDVLDYSIAIDPGLFQPNGFGGTLEYVLSGDLFGVSYGAFSSYLAQATGYELPFFDRMEFELRTSLAPIPVPAALPLLAGGLGVLGLIGWRRRQRAAA